MADFQKFLPVLLKHEGGFVDRADDPGGATNKGVTLQTFRQFAQPLLNVEPTLANLKALTDEQAGVIYKSEYWDKTFADQIPLQELAEIVVDFRVNSGANAIELLQRILNVQGADPQLAVDGAMGPATLARLQAANAIRVYRAYREGRKAYYRNIATLNPKFQVFLNGWLNRVESFPNL